MSDQPSEQGIVVFEGVVQPEWIDINGHMNVAYYVLAFDHGVDALWTDVGLTDEYIETRNMSTFAVESHVTYQAELKEGEPYKVATQILAIDDKRLHQFQRMYHATEGYLAATAEWLNLHVNLETRRVCPWPDDIREAFIAVAEKQQDTQLDDLVGKQIRITNPHFSIY